MEAVEPRMAPVIKLDNVLMTIRLLRDIHKRSDRDRMKLGIETDR